MQIADYTKQQAKAIISNELFPFIKRYLADAELLKTFERKSERLDEYHIAVIGKPGWGKSTLLNALIGIELLPTASKGDTTGVITYIYHQDKGTDITVHYKSGTHKSVKPQKGALDKYVNKGSEKRPDISHIEIRTPLGFMNHPDLQAKNINCLALLDTPGEGSSAYKELSVPTYEKMKEADAIIAFVRYQRSEKNDANLLKHLRELRTAEGSGLDQKIHIVANQIDSDTEYMKSGDFKPSQDEVYGLYKDIFPELTFGQIVGVSAKYALLCRLLSQTYDKAMGELTVTDLEQHIEKLPGDQRCPWREMKATLDTLVDTVPDCKKPIETLYRRSRIEALENAIVRYLLHTDTKAAPTRQLTQEGMATTENIIAKLKNAIEKQQAEIARLDDLHRQNLREQVAKNEQRMRDIDAKHKEEKKEFKSDRNDIITQLNNQVKDAFNSMHMDTALQINKLATLRIGSEVSNSSWTTVVHTGTSIFANLRNTHHQTLGAILEKLNELQSKSHTLLNRYEVEFRGYFETYAINNPIDQGKAIERSALKSFFSENYYGFTHHSVFFRETESKWFVPDFGYYYIYDGAIQPLRDALNNYKSKINGHISDISSDLERGELSLFGFFDQCAKTVKERLVEENRQLEQTINQRGTPYDIPETREYRSNIANLKADIAQLNHIHSRLMALLNNK